MRQAACRATVFLLMPFLFCGSAYSGDENGKGASGQAVNHALPNIYLDLRSSYSKVPADTLSIGFGNTFSSALATLQTLSQKTAPLTPNSTASLPASQNIGIDVPLTVDVTDRISVYGGITASAPQSGTSDWATLALTSWSAGFQADVYQQNGGSIPTVRMKVIFLDIDGVLNNDETPNPRKFPYVVDSVLLGRLNSVLAITDAKVVLTSTWRVDPVGLLAARHFGVPFLDVTPDQPDAPRCGEIMSWLHAHPEVVRYAVLDDSNDCLDELPLFQPSSKLGLDREVADGLVAYLMGASDKDMRQPALVRLGQNIEAMFKRNKS